jgi:PAS domain S-box-containing protein
MMTPLWKLAGGKEPWPLRRHLLLFAGLVTLPGLALCAPLYSIQSPVIHFGLAAIGATLTSGVMAYWFARRLGIPIMELSRAAQQIDSPIPIAAPHTDITEVAAANLALRDAQDRVARNSKQLRESEVRLAGIVSIAADAIITVDSDYRITLFNEGAEIVFGYRPAEVLGRPLNILLPERLRAAHNQHVTQFVEGAVTSRRMGERRPIFGLHRDGHEFPAEASISRVETGQGRILTVVLRDITERQASRLALEKTNEILEARVAARTQELEAEMRRRQDAQSALVQAQRLEAVGQLTGGVAHDFNNLLTIITGNLELLAERNTDPEAAALVARAASAAEMGARLTSRLLTFARRRKLAPSILDLSVQVVGLSELLNRTLGEEIQLTTHLATDLWSTRADPSEVENTVVNLAINARDAMPKGGRLVIETTNVVLDGGESGFGDPIRPGEYVRLTMSDTGTGMSQETLKKVFEPFFTTKEPGRGTGLGLSTVYGFARQSGGHVTIYSEIGRGTTVRLYLPRVDGEAATEIKTADSAVPMSESGETVLVVEDNPEVREIAMQRMEGLGYVAVEAVNGAAAIALLQSGREVDLVFSDVVMPGGVSGFDVARWVATHRPQVKMLLTSGFSEGVAESGAVPTPWPILQKPYNRRQLAEAIAAALGRT